MKKYLEHLDKQIELVELLHANKYEIAIDFIRTEFMEIGSNLLDAQVSLQGEPTVCAECNFYFSQKQNNGNPAGCLNGKVYTIVDLAGEDATKFGCNHFQRKHSEPRTN
jgi:hypothetical protein